MRRVDHTEVPFPSLLLMYSSSAHTQALGSLPGRVSVGPSLHQKMCPTYLPVPIYPEPPSGRYGTYLPATYLSSSAGRQLRRMYVSYVVTSLTVSTHR